MHGRFHAFDIARELLKLGHDVRLFTNLPSFFVRRFGFPPARTASFVSHGIASRLLWRLFPRGMGGLIERLCNTAFGRWAGERIRNHRWDVVVGFSGVSEEAFRGRAGGSAVRFLHRGSSHIRFQRELMEREAARSDGWMEIPSDWIIEREEREYQVSDGIHVLSDFARHSFLKMGFPANRVFPVSLGVSLRDFQARPRAVADRIQRISSGQPLRILNVGTFCRRKGALDLSAVTRQLAGGNFQFRFVGPVAEDSRLLCGQMAGIAEFAGHRPQSQLPAEYEWGDVFVLPTLEDGFAAVLCQALAAGLPLVTTDRCAGPELIRKTGAGWIVPAADPAALARTLLRLEADRASLLEAVRVAACSDEEFGWSATAATMARNFHEAIVNSKHLGQSAQWFLSGG